MKIKRLACLIGIFTMVVWPPAVAHAAEPDPDSVALDDIVIFNSLLVTDDILAFVPYNLPFAVAPSVDISQAYIFRMLSADGLTEIGTVTATPAYNDGYGRGVVSFYIPSGFVTGTVYKFRVQQNPVHYPSPLYFDFTIGSSNYNTETDQALALRDEVVLSAVDLTIEFGAALLSRSEGGDLVLSTAGELYYLDVIPGLQAMAPSLFSVQLQNPDFSERSWSTSFADALQTKYAGTFIDEFMTGYAGLFTIDTSPAMNSFSMILFIIIIGASVAFFKGTILSALLDGYVGLLGLMLIGFFSMIWAGFMAFILAAVGGAIIWFKRA